MPVVDPDSYVHPTSTLIGDVIVGARCFVGPGAVMRGDLGPLVMEPGGNLQDNCVIHTTPGINTVLAEGCIVGHGAILHGCRVGRRALIGMNAVVMDEAEIGEHAFVGALALSLRASRYLRACWHSARPLDCGDRYPNRKLRGWTVARKSIKSLRHDISNRCFHARHWKKSKRRSDNAVKSEAVRRP